MLSLESLKNIRTEAEWNTVLASVNELSEINDFLTKLNSEECLDSKIFGNLDKNTIIHRTFCVSLRDNHQKTGVALLMDKVNELSSKDSQPVMLEENPSENNVAAKASDTFPSETILQLIEENILMPSLRGMPEAFIRNNPLRQHAQLARSIKCIFNCLKNAIQNNPVESMETMLLIEDSLNNSMFACLLSDIKIAYPPTQLDLSAHCDILKIILELECYKVSGQASKLVTQWIEKYINEQSMPFISNYFANPSQDGELASVISATDSAAAMKEFHVLLQRIARRISTTEQARNFLTHIIQKHFMDKLDVWYEILESWNKNFSSIYCYKASNNGLEEQWKNNFSAQLALKHKEDKPLVLLKNILNNPLSLRWSDNLYGFCAENLMCNTDNTPVSQWPQEKKLLICIAFFNSPKLLLKRCDYNMQIAIAIAQLTFLLKDEQLDIKVTSEELQTAIAAVMEYKNYKQSNVDEMLMSLKNIQIKNGSINIADYLEELTAEQLMLLLKDDKLNIAATPEELNAALVGIQAYSESSTSTPNALNVAPLQENLYSRLAKHCLSLSSNIKKANSNSEDPSDKTWWDFARLSFTFSYVEEKTNPLNATFQQLRKNELFLNYLVYLATTSERDKKDSIGMRIMNTRRNHPDDISKESGTMTAVNAYNGKNQKAATDQDNSAPPAKEKLLEQITSVEKYKPKSWFSAKQDTTGYSTSSLIGRRGSREFNNNDKHDASANSLELKKISSYKKLF